MMKERVGRGNRGDGQADKFCKYSNHSLLLSTSLNKKKAKLIIKKNYQFSKCGTKMCPAFCSPTHL